MRTEAFASLKAKSRESLSTPLGLDGWTWDLGFRIWLLLRISDFGLCGFGALAEQAGQFLTKPAQDVGLGGRRQAYRLPSYAGSVEA